MSREYYNLNEVLRWRAEHSSNQPAFTFLKDNGEEEAQWSYAELDHAARVIAGHLQESVSIGQRVLLLFPPSLEFVAAFWGCLYAGAIAVPAYPVRSQANVQRLKNIVEDCQPSAVLTTRRGLLRMKHAIDSDLAALQWIETDSLSQELADAWQEPQINRDSIALLQYTSGSTGQPKGVVVSHGNLLHNEEIIQSTFSQSQRSVIVGWLPLYHDMGLMGTMLQPVYSGARCILMSPNAFLQRPFRWLEAISRYRATTSGGPNFAYELCVRKITDEECAALDLSSWTVAFNGAETVRAETLEKFSARFAEVGFSPESFRPCYGLAEATLLVSAQSSRQRARHLMIDANQLGHNRVKVVAAGRGAIEVVSCGRTAHGHEIAIVDPETFRRQAPNQIGEIWVAGPSVAKGYWNRPEETRRLFAARTTDTGEGPFLRTGDLGFIRNRSLFITGRSKDLIIIRGRNHYPQDVELTVQAAHPAFKPGLGAAFSVPGEQGECLVVLQELEHGKEPQLNGAIDSICQAIAEQHEIQAHAVLLLRAGTLPRTSSGKIQRYLCRDLFLQERLSPIVEWRAGARVPIASSAQRALKSAEGIQEWLVEKIATWAGVAHENIQVHEPISRYGLDSLASIELSHAAERELALSLPLSSLMQGKSIVELTRELMNGTSTFAELQAEPQAGNVIEEGALSEGQKSLWYLHQLAPESTAYNLAFVARIVDGADTRVLRQIFQTLVERHHSLRTTFHTTDAGEPFQRIHAFQNASVVEVDASGWSDSDLKQHFQEQADTHFNLELGPLFRVTLFRRSESECFIAITLHHIIGDLWSLAMLLDEMGTLYAAETKGEKLTLPPLESSYAHFVLWQRKMISGAEGARLNAYWTRQLEGELPVLELSTDRMRPTIQTYHGAATTFDLGAELTHGLRNVSHDNNTTLNVILLAAFQVLLHRHSGQRDILVGSPAANRTRASWANVFGYFVNPVVLRSQFQRNLPFDEFLAETRTTVVEALEHQHYPFSRLVEKLQPQRDPSRSPLFQATFVFEKTRFLEEEGISAFALGRKGTRLEFDGLTFESVSLESTKAHFDLTLRVAEAGEGTRCAFEYNTDLFNEETISRMAGQWRQLLHAIVATETTPVRDLPLLNDAERKQIVEEWNRTERDYPQRCLHDLFEDQVKRTPKAVALEYENECLSYEELNRRSNQLAHYLRSLGVGPEVRVALCMDRSLEMMVSIMAVLKAGGAYLPLDPSYPAERLSYMLENSAAPVLLAQAQLQEKLLSYTGKTIQVDTEWETIEQYSDANLRLEVSGENLAYVIYTSGSTGLPKGVMVEHRSICNYLRWAQDSYYSGGGNGSPAVHSVGFDGLLTTLFCPILAGERLTLLPAGGEIEALAEHSRKSKAPYTLLKLTPSHLRLLNQALSGEGLKAPTQRLMVGGEPMVAVDVAWWQRRFPEVKLSNHFGPTETTVGSCSFEIMETITASTAVSIGQPVTNTRVYILDDAREPVPVGVTGEVYIGGVGVARGYLNRPELTAESFLADPYASEAGVRMYKTGDFGRWREDGNIELLGRNDFQVKIRGFRIELGEIEARLREHAGVGEAVVVAREDVPGEKRLVAYVVGAAKEDGSGQVELDGSELRRHLRGHLPEYMVPSAYVQMKEIPLTGNGKVDRKRLPQPQAVQAGAQDRKPRTVEEEILCGIWSEVLKVDRVGIEDNFFALGGHSLLATQMISRTRAVFGVELPLRVLFETNTLAEFASQVECARKKQEKAEIPAIMPLPREGTFPLSFAEQRLWFLQQMQPASAAYNCPVVLRLSGELDREVLARSLQSLVTRHEMLRTTFPSQDGSPVQKINQDIAPQLHVTDLESLPDEEKEKTVEQIAAEETNQPYDLAIGPLFRMQLLRLNRQEHVLLVTMHHIITDAWSNGILIREFVELYTAHCQGRAPQLEELSLQYADFAVWQRNWLKGEVCEKQMNYWRRQLEGATTLEIPTDYPRPINPTNAGAALHFDISADLLARLNELARRQGVTLFMMLLAAFKVLLGRVTGQTDIATGTVIANRRNKDTESLIGFFVNQLVLRADVNGDSSFRVFLERVRTILLDAYDNQDVPFEKVVEELMPGRTSTRSPFFDVVFAMQNVQGEKIKLPGLDLRSFSAAELPTKWDLTFIVQERETGLVASLYYATELFAEITARRFTECYAVLLWSIVQDIERPISELNLLTDAERQQLEVEWNDSRRAFPDQTAIDLFRIQVETQPLASAVVFGERTLTYKELDKLTNQLGRYLRSLGVQAETRVGLYLERGVDLITGALGVLKAGGAYVPLDPAYPAERLAFMAEDAQLSVILTQDSLYQDFPGQWVSKVCLDQDWSRIASEDPGALDSVISPLNVAYIIYTSGSTGQPKGVCLSHQGLCNLALAQKEIFHLTPGASVLQFSSFSFDAATWEMSMALLSGARLVLGSKEQLLPGAGLLDVLKVHSVTVATIPPSVLAALQEDHLPALETLVVAGEACNSELVQRWSNGRRMLNAYGPTETTVCATISQPLSLSQLTPPIGRPIANMQVYVLDEHLALAPLGAGGELCVAGAGLARGYLNRPELTAEKFVPNPYGEAGGRLYRTGDRVRWRFDGQLEFLGRVDDQIKLRGFRIELGEIEAVLRQVAGVRQVAVLAAEEETGDKRLVAYVVPDHCAPKSLANGHLLANGRRIAHQNANETDFLFREIFDESTYAKHGISLHEESCVLDVGANIGMFMLWASEQAPRGRVYSFEPIGALFEHLRRNATLCDSEVKLFPIGLAESDRTTEFVFYPRHTGMSGLAKYVDPQADLELTKKFIANQQQNSPEAEEFLREATDVLASRFEREECEVRVRRLSDVLREEKIEHVDLLKIDVERAELDVLNGIDAEDLAKIDQMVIEVHDEAGKGSEGRVEIIRGLLDRAGYEVVVEEEASLRGMGLWIVYASRRGHLELGSAGNGHSQSARVLEKELDIAALKGYAQERLPDYMVPGLYIELDEIPLTINGKVDRKALLELRTRATGNTNVQEQRELYSPVQEIVAGIWCEVLGLEQVGCEANFFEIGGHSLLATQVISRIREAFGVDIELHALFENPHLHRLAEVIEEARQETAAIHMPPIQRADRSKDLPLSFAQQRLWFIDQMDPGNPTYNAHFGARLSGELNYNAVRQSLTSIVQRHEVLRTSFQMISNEPRQIIGPAENILRVVDLSGTDPEKREAEARQLALHEQNTKFDLAQGPLMRAVLVKLDEHEHLLLITMHHIVGDGWSLAILVREFMELYRAEREQREAKLEELPIQYGDYAVWQREWLEGGELQEQMRYWKEQLAGLETLELPTDHPRPAVMSHRGATVEMELGEELTSQVRELCRREGVTLFMALLAGVQVLLGRHAGQQEVAAGTPIANRTRQEIEPLIGFFVNTLVLRGEVRREWSFREMLKRVREVTLAAYAHQDVPFEHLVEELQPVRDLSRNPLFEVMLSVQNTPQESFRLPGLSVEALDTEQEVAKFDLMFSATESGGKIRIGINYATELYEQETIERMGGHFRAVVEEMVRNTDSRIGEVPILSEGERAELEGWNRTEVMYSDEKCVHKLFEEQAEKQAEAIAVEYEGERLSYGELNRRVNRMGHYLRKKGIGPEVRVGVYLQRGLRLMEVWLGTVKAGGVYVPLDPNYPAERVRYMAEDAGVELVVTEGEMAWRWMEESGEKKSAKQTSSEEQTWETRVLRLDEVTEEIEREEEKNPEVRIGASNLAYVMYTSGSTGRPKGVMIEHGGMQNHLQAKIEELGLSEEDKVAATAPSSFDISIWQMTAALLVGGCVEMMGEEIAREGGRLLEELDKRGVTVMETVPAQLAVMLEEVRRKKDRPGLKKLRWMMSNAEALPGGLCEEWRVQYPETALLNAYGPTECSDDVTHWKAEESWGRGKGYAPLGHPLRNSQVYVVDSQMELVPVGVAGEVCLGGRGVGRGYWGQAGLTAEKFVPKPYGGGAGERMYRTGDVGRWRREGNLEFIHRMDAQVKVRGHRIELGEIEAALLEDPGVKQAVVVVRETESGEKQLVAYWVGGSEGEDESGREMGQRLRRHVQERLPEYMVPSAFVVLQELPLNANGKVDRKRLPQPQAVEAGAQDQKPRTVEEEILCGIWEQVLKVERVGVEENFFAIGGHSLLATQVVSRMREAFGVEMPLRVLFERPTIAGLAEAVRQARTQEGGRTVKPLQRAGNRGNLPLSYGQQRLWFLEQMEPGNAVYNVPFALRMRGDLDRGALSRSIRRIVERHEALRTVFVWNREQEPVQRVLSVEEAGVVVEVMELGEMGAEQREAEARRLAGVEVGEGFNLSTGPLLRVKLLGMGEQDHVLLVTMHHIVSDGWSVGVLVREFMELYRAEREQSQAMLEELPIQYGDYAAWQREWLEEGGELQEQMEYWKEQLAGLETLELPTDHPRPAVMSHRGATVEMELGEELTSQVRELCRREGVTLFMALLAGVQVLLGRYAGQQEVAAGTPIANRTRQEIEPLIGFFVNTLVLRGEVRREWSFREMLKRVREVTLAAYAHQDVPFEHLVEELQPVRDLSRNPLFEVMLIVQNTPQESFRLPGLSVETLGTEGEVAKFDLMFSAAESGGKIRVGINYATELYEQETIERMGGHFRAVVEEMTRNADSRIGEVTILSDAERAQLEGWNRTEREYPQRWVHELFEDQVKRTPEAVAVEYEDERLNYQELNRRANQLAHYLRSMGVGPEVRVGICMERSLEMVVAIMAVLKAGGAYMPLDPSYPAERLRYMLEGSAAPVLLGQAHLQEKWLSYTGKTIHVDAEWGRIGQCCDANLRNEVSRENLAYVIYTSGSTGKPKGAMNTHRGLSNRVQWMQQAYGLTAGDRVLQKTPFAFDVSVWEFVWPLVVGARLVMLRPGGHQDPACIAEAIQRKQITTVHFVPAMLRAFLANGGAEQSGSLSRIICSGEALDRDLARECREQIGAELHNLYGPTEASIDVTFWDCSELTDVVRIGRPIANAQIHVLDSELQTAPVGVAGELYIGGAGLARGYVNQAGLTAERFVPDPFASSGGERLYRTGDRVRWHGDGSLEYLGRLDQQVKIHGYRIELGEIEAVLHGIAGVKQGVVIVREDAPGDKRLVGYLVVEEIGRGEQEFEEHVQEEMRRQLPQYMRLGTIVQMKEIPLTANGKVDRKRLPAPEVEAKRGQTEGGEYEEPRSGAEKILAGIWEQVLRVERVGRKDKFFELGGDSILSIKVATRAAEAGLEVTVQQIFQQQTLAELAKVAGGSGKREKNGKKRKEGVRQEEVGGAERERVGAKEKVPLTAIQEWFFEQELEEMEHFNQGVMLKVKAGVRGERVRETVKAVLEHHEAVGLRYRKGEEGKWEQWYEDGEGIGSGRGVDWEEVDLRGMTEEEQRRVMAENAERAQKGMNLERGPLARGVYFARGDEEQGRLLLVLHHLIVDGVSWRILLEDVEKGLRQMELVGEVVKLGESDTMQRWTETLWGWVEGGELEREEGGYWLKLKERDGIGRLPRDYEGGENRMESRERLMRELSKEETKILLREGPKRLQAQMQEILLVGLVEAVGKWSGERGVLVEMEGHGREGIMEGVDVSRTLGWFTSLYPVWLPVARWAGLEVLEEQVRKVKEVMDGIPRKGIGYGLLRYVSKNEDLRERLKGLPQPEIIFNYLGQWDEGEGKEGEGKWLELAEEGIGECQSGKQARGHIFEVTAAVMQGRMKVEWSYGRDLHRRETVEKLMNWFMQTLHSIAKLCQPNTEESYQARFPMARLKAEQLRAIVEKVERAHQAKY